jgi:multidrug resistance efflux pump
MSYQSDDEPLFSKNEIREIRMAMAEIMNENEELRSKIVAMNQMVKQREATLKKANLYIKHLEQFVKPSNN